MSSNFPNIFPDSAEASCSINFHSVHPHFELEDEDSLILQRWIKEVIELEQNKLIALQYIFCEDDYLYDLNIAHLNHDTLTDIITFPYDQPPNIHSDIFISIDRVRDNAEKFNAPFREELHRVMIHGVLHLCGYRDKTSEEARQMRAKEDETLQLLAQFDIS